MSDAKPAAQEPQVHPPAGGAPRPPRGPMMGPPPIEAPRDYKKTLKRLLRYFENNKALMVTSIFFIAVSSVLKASVPMLIGYAIKHDLERSNNLPDFIHWMEIILATIIGSWIADAGCGILMTRLSNNIVFRMREDSFANAQTLSMSAFDKRGIGDFISRMTNDVEMVFMSMNNGFVGFVGGLFLMVAYLVFMLILSIPLSFLVLAVMPFMAVLTGIMGKKIRGAFRKNQEWVGRLTANIEESVSGIKVTKTFRREEAEFAKFEKVNDASQRIGVKSELLAFAFMPLMNIMTSLTLGLIVGVGSYMALKSAAGGVSIGLLTSFILYSQRFFEPLRQITQVYSMVQSALAGAERLFEMMDMKPEVIEKPDALSLNDIRGAVKFDNVGFAYEADKTILADINFQTHPGQIIAIVGPTGAGKTTLINLLSRFYDVRNGSIAIDGINVRDLKLNDLRTRMGIVLQETFFFATTIRENLLYARPDATEEEMISAARTANAHYFISRLPHGYDTVLTERGNNLSQGERQLLGIARAILSNPRILVLDEATSSVDSLTEAHIQEGLIRLMKGRTSFIIAHRLSTIRNADQVLVLHNHRIIESGTHDRLINKPDGFYAKLYGMQGQKPEILESDFAPETGIDANG
jgi:ATP-binding cassette, subfamily B, multidrug efflux pump